MPTIELLLLIKFLTCLVCGLVNLATSRVIACTCFQLRLCGSSTVDPFPLLLDHKIPLFGISMVLFPLSLEKA